ncbi:MAG: hypothetical protein ABJK64_12315 [Paraglaciecola sp.]|uniref:hypothetical protein n=1 Tax=Paraglaciecola sp. TaxID=1920173 RepID=UPI003297CB5F
MMRNVHEPVGILQTKAQPTNSLYLFLCTKCMGCGEVNKSKHRKCFRRNAMPLSVGGAVSATA